MTTTITPTRTQVTVCIAGMKGGLGKTTSAFCLCEAAGRAGERVLLVDADPQRSAIAWHEAASREERAPLFDATSMSDVRPGLTDGYEFVVIDCAPGWGEAKLTEEAMRVSDLVLIPMNVSGLERRELPFALEMADRAKTPVAILPVRLDLRTQAAMRLIKGQPLEPSGRAMTRARIPRRANLESAAGDHVPQKLHGYDVLHGEIANAIRGNEQSWD